jgi:hypothetical protein
MLFNPYLSKLISSQVVKIWIGGNERRIIYKLCEKMAHFKLPWCHAVTHPVV